MNDKKKLRGHLFSILCVVAWGTSFLVSKSLMEKLHMHTARVYVSGQNLLTLKSSGLTCSDPENPNWAYPNYTSFSFGLQLGF